MENYNAISRKAIQTGKKFGYLESDKIPNFSFDGSQSFTLGFNICLSEENNNSTIFKQGKYLEVGFNNLTFYFNSPLGNFEVKNDTVEFKLNVWYSVTVVYNQSEIILYINGLKIKSYKKTLISGGQENYYIGYNFSGFIQSIYLYACSLNDSDILANYNTNALCKEKELIAWFDFTENRIFDKSKNQINIHQGKGSLVVISNLCPVLSFEDNGYITIDNLKSTKGDFSFLSKFYPLSREPETIATLYSNIEKEGETGISIKIKYIDYNTCNVTIKINTLQKTTKYINSDIVINSKSWNDVGFTYSKKQLTLFVNGKSSGSVDNVDYECLDGCGTDYYGISLNNNQQMDQYIGYVSYASKFDKLLSIENYSNYIKNPPFILDSKISSLIYFSDFSYLDKLTFQKYNLFKGSKFIYAVGTQNANINTTQSVAVSDDSCKAWDEYSELDKWNIVQYSIIISEYCIAAGLIKEAAESWYKVPSIANYLNKSLKSNSKFTDLIQKGFDMTSKDVSLVLSDSAGAIEATSTILGGALAGAEVAMSGICGIALSSLLTEIIAGVLAGLGIGAITMCLAKILATIIADLKDRPDPDPNYDSITIQLNKVVFNTNPKDCAISSIAIYNSYNDKTLAKDWTGINNLKEYSNIAYIKSQITKQVTIKIEITVENLKLLKDVKIDLHIENSSLFGDYVIKGISAISGIIPLSLTLDKNKLAEAQIGTSKEEIKWRAVLPGSNEKPLGTSYHNVHIIKDKCVSPWDIEKEDGYPNVDALNLFNTLYKNKANDNIVMELSDNIYNLEIFKARKDNLHSYSNVMMINYEGCNTNIAFDAKRFMDDYKAETMKTLSSLDTCLLLIDMARLQGIPDLKPICLEQNLSYAYYKDLNAFNPQMYTLDNVKFIGDKTYTDTITKLWRHYVVTKGYVAEKYDFLCYDSYFKTKSADSKELSLNDKPFSMNDYEFVVDKNDAYYRESLFLKSCFCEIIYVISQYAKVTIEYLEPIELNNLQEAKRSLSQGKMLNPDKFERPANREYFLQAINDGTPMQMGNKVICHLVSYDVINTTICKYISGIQFAQKRENEWLQFLDNFIKTITGGYQDPIAIQVNNTWKEVKVKAKESGYNINDLLWRDMCQLIEHLGHCCYNLRLGDESWNQAIKNDWDVENWCYISKQNGEDWVISSDMSLIKPELLSEYNGFGINKPNNPIPGFYLRNLNMQRRKDYSIWTDGYLAFAVKMASKPINGILIPLIYSSNNSYDHVTKSYDKRLNAQLYYLSPNDTWTAIFG